MSRAARVLFSALVLFAAGAQAQETQGFGEVRLSLFPGESGQKWQLVERVRPTFEAGLGERMKLVATIEAGLVEGLDTSAELENTLRRSDFEPLLEANGCVWPVHRNPFFRIDGADNYLGVDRLYVDAYFGKLDLRVGRQALNWGSAQFFNPTDPFPEVLLAEPWRPRRGVNAMRLNIPLGEGRDVTAVAAVNDTLNEMRAAGRFRVNISGTDVALAAAWRGQKRGLVGLDLRGTLGVGWWVEGAYLLGDSPHEEIATGIDYSFPILERATAFAEYYRNGAGSTNPSATARGGTLSATGGPVCATGSLPLAATERDPFAPFVAGRDYLVVGATLAISPDLSTSVSGLQNLNDGSGLLVPTVSYNVLDWLDVAVSAQVPYALDANGGELKPRPEDLVISTDVPELGGKLSADLSGLVPAATVTFWTRASF